MRERETEDLKEVYLRWEQDESGVWHSHWETVGHPSERLPGAGERGLAQHAGLEGSAGPGQSGDIRQGVPAGVAGVDDGGADAEARGGETAVGPAEEAPGVDRAAVKIREAVVALVESAKGDATFTPPTPSVAAAMELEVSLLEFADAIAHEISHAIAKRLLPLFTD